MIQQIPKKLHQILHRVYGSPASITKIKGHWKTGKTDFALLLSEITRQEGIIHDVASNIDTKGSGEVEFINDFTKFDYWLFKDNRRKLYLYDEVIESAPGRRAMSALNVGWLKRIPQLSKGKCHLVVIIQAEDMADSVFSLRTFNRGIWIKLDKTTVVWRGIYASKALKILSIPKTSIIFDPYLPATFSLEDTTLNFSLLPETLKVLVLYGDNKSFETIQRELNIKHIETVRRNLHKACRAVGLTLSHNPTEGKEIAKACESIPS